MNDDHVFIFIDDFNRFPIPKIDLRTFFILTVDDYAHPHCKMSRWNEARQEWETLETDERTGEKSWGFIKQREIEAWYIPPDPQVIPIDVCDECSLLLHLALFVIGAAFGISALTLAAAIWG